MFVFEPRFEFHTSHFLLQNLQEQVLVLFETHYFGTGVIFDRSAVSSDGLR